MLDAVAGACTIRPRRDTTPRAVYPTYSHLYQPVGVTNGHERSAHHYR